jgi:hypothetical protein
MRARVIAAVTALWLVIGGVLVVRHESSVAHVRDAVGRLSTPGSSRETTPAATRIFTVSGTRGAIRGSVRY